MAQPSSSPTIQKSSRDRAISSEPCSTRPNPFEDDNIPPKRRRTSLNSPPRRSRSVDTAAASSPDALLGAGHEPASGATSDSAMKIDSDSTPAQTPEKQILGPEPDPSSVVRSSRVTINVRTPSRLPLDAESSSPSGSPTSPLANKGVAESPGDAVKISIEESEVDMPRGDAAMDTPVSSTAGSGSPPVEVVTVIPDDEDEYEDPEPITILDDSADDSIQIDPTPTYPCRKELETWHEATLRISEHILHNTQVVREVYGWLNKYIRFTQSSSTSVVLRSYNEYQELWRSFSELVLYVAEKKPYSSNLYRNVRQDIMNFWKWIARLTALFVKLDNHNNVHHKSSSNQADRSLTPMSSKFVQALSLLNRRDEILHHTSAALSAGDDWSYANEASKVLDVFQSFIQDGGGTISAVMQLAYAEAQRLSQDSSLTEHISGLCALASQILHQIRRGVDSPVPQVSHNAKASIARAFRFFENMSPILTGLVDRNPGHITLEGAAYFIQSLSEIYQIALNIEGTVPVNVLTSHLQRHPQIPRHLVPDAITYIWKFSLFAKLIKSSQMQLRVMAVSNMCSDLVSIYRRYGDQVEDPNRPMMQFYGEFLIKTGLVKYILGPTCHPEVTVESANIIGFLAVSHTYEHEHTDALWQTVSTTPDPRVSEALLKLLKPILQLFQPEALLYFCSKLLTVPVSNFGMAMREFFSEIVKNLVRPAYHGTITDSAPYDLCIRLIRQSSAFGSQSPVAWLELQQLAVRKLKDLLQHGPGPEGRQRIALDCLDDLSRPSPSTIGSLWVLSSIIRPHVHREISVLVSEYNLARILVDELEGAIPRACAAGFPAVISGSHNEPRKDLLSLLISHEAASLTGELGARLWRLLVGSGAASKEDRDAGWQLLNSAMKRSQVVNNFTSACFSEYLPTLDPEDYCLGTLDFVRARIMPFVNDPLSIVLDDDESTDRAGIDMLWHMVLTAPKDTIEMQAIDTLVREVYMESRSILAFPHYRASKVHLALVGRCLQQLSSAAVKLRSFADGTASGDEDSMVLVATDQEVMKQELLFIRSLVVLREFHRLHQGKPEFSAPDLRALIGDSPKQVEGDSAELKFQSFDGDTQTAIKPLNIGRLNTAGSLLASLREATGFSNYRIYYRGKPFVPQESEICKSLEDLQIHNGIILVKKETEPVASPRTRPGASRLEAEILGHFEELWQYLSMEEKLAREMYLFLVKLPVDEHFLKSFETASVSYQDMFPMGQPFKSLYAVHALHSYLDSRPQDQAAETSPAEGDDASESSRASGASFARAMSLVVPALSDANVVARCSTFEMQIELGSALLKFFVFLLKDPRLPRTAGQFLDQQVLGRLLTLISTCFSADTSASVEEYVPLCLESILESCYVSEGFLSAFCHHPEVPNMVKRLLLLEHRDAIRQKAANLIRVACKLGEAEGDHSKPDSIALTLREVFWPIVSDLIRPAIISIGTSTELLSLSCALFNTLIRDGDDALDLAVLSREWFDLLLNYRTCEDVTKPHLVDDVASHLVSLLHVLMRAATIESDEESRHRILPSGDVAANIFWKHLYPVVDEKTAKKYASGNPVLTSPTRAMLQEIVLRLVKDDEEQFSRLIDDMYDLVQVDTSQELSDIYQYELLASTQFEREKAIRAECGYTGLRNLSNTCYFNSLYTQLFMNVDFRRFMLAATVDDTDSQSLLWNTKKTFAYLQNSIRRCISPEDCVASIRTYENGHIDINVQMDAEEFFNLLFDRWEGQFLTEQERNEFRSFYGGQLVHQVRSKECDHISESLEPFSAIQCVIKGKSTLHESLQAYVDGEILEDENKYKCSTCDKNVDAVKRTCIKEAPDNLIFHLKRFDYNVRTMQRFKINDWFSFPTMIDMRPYTVDFLDNPDQDHPEDLFELVGVLVHTGTTESGHYYSFVRERPGSDGKQTWVEFNDDVVSPWDPTHMEGSCFGGPEYQPFQNNATQFDKQNSAYMLFYQRTSSLARSQSLLRQSGLSSPLRVDVPKELEIHIHSDNNQILRRHCIYDTCQTEFVLKILSQLKSPSRGVCHEAHRKETTAMFMALGHLDQVTSRAKDTPNFARLVACLRGSCHSCARCSMALFKYFVEVPETFRMLVQRNPDPDVRKSAANLLIRALSVLRDVLSDQYGLNDDEDITADDNTSLLSGVMAIIDTLWANFPGHIRSWNEVFGFMLSFVKLGSAEVAVFLANRHLATLLWIIMADPAIEKMPNSIQRMLLALSRRQTARQPNYDSIIGLLDVLLAHVRLSDRDHKSRYGQYAYENHTRRTPVSEPPFDLLQEEGELLMLGWNHIKSNIFVEKLINIGQNPQSTDSIIANLIQQSFEMETLIYRTLRTAITGSVVAHTVGNYLRVAGGVFCRFASNRTLINELIKHTSAQCIGIQSTEGREFLEFQRQVFDGPRERSGETPHQVILAGLDVLPLWVPGLLAYQDTTVSEEVERFLHEKLFRQRTLPDPATEEGIMLAAQIKATGRALGSQCLIYLHDRHIKRSLEISERVVTLFQRVIKVCSRYFDIEDPEDMEASDFETNRKSVLDAVVRLAVADDLEEDGSDWENSSICSGQLDNVGGFTTI